MVTVEESDQIFQMIFFSTGCIGTLWTRGTEGKHGFQRRKGIKQHKLH